MEPSLDFGSDSIWIASRIYRTGLLMYGKRPSFGEVARWLRRS